VLVATAAGPPMMLARPAVLARLMTPRRYLDRADLERVAGNLYGGSARTAGRRPARPCTVPVMAASGTARRAGSRRWWTVSCPPLEVRTMA